MSEWAKYRSEAVRVFAIVSIGPWLTLIEPVVSPPPCNPRSPGCYIVSWPELDLIIAATIGMVLLLGYTLVRAARWALYQNRNASGGGQ